MSIRLQACQIFQGSFSLLADYLVVVVGPVEGLLVDFHVVVGSYLLELGQDFLILVPSFLERSDLPGQECLRRRSLRSLLDGLPDYLLAVHLLAALEAQPSAGEILSHGEKGGFF